MTRVQEFEYAASPGSVMVMHSDGISARWKLTQYPGVMARSAAVIAGMLYRDFSRMRDDATVLVAQLAPFGSGAAEGVPLG